MKNPSFARDLRYLGNSCHALATLLENDALGPQAAAEAVGNLYAEMYLRLEEIGEEAGLPTVVPEPEPKLGPEGPEGMAKSS